MLRSSQLANLQALDEDTVNCERQAHKQGCGDWRRERYAVSPDDSMADIDRPMDDIEALLSCPHANPKSLSETQTLGIQTSALALERPITIAHRAIAAPV
jgi:hypothetical protein